MFQEKTAAKETFKIGITGGIGAGKSTVCKVFAALGIPVYDADSQAKRLLVQDAVLMEQVISHFGPEAYFPEGGLNRVWLGQQVFGQPERLTLLNELVHPRVGIDFLAWYRQQDAPYVLKEAALLFEAGSFKELDAVINVSAPENLRIRRTVMRDEHRSKSQVEEIIQRQLPEAERNSRADFKILNDGVSMVLPQVLRLHRQFLRGELPVRE